MHLCVLLVFSFMSTLASSASPTCVLKTVAALLPKVSRHWVGDGFHVRPVFGRLAFTKHLSPFLMLDYANEDFQPNQDPRRRKGVGQHPHRGFETVTLAFQGEIEHADNKGNRDVIKNGDVQWMTAGAGIVHEEFHGIEWAKQGGTVEMVQLWVNLPTRHKMTPANYQALTKADIPRVELRASSSSEPNQESNQASTSTTLGTLRVVAGAYNDAKGPGTTFSEMNVWDINLSAMGQTVQLDVPDTHNTMLLVRKGEIEVLDQNNVKTTINSEQMVLFTMGEGNAINLVSNSDSSDVLLLSGVPFFDEPIANRGPFVMNTNAELRQAQMDYQSGKF